MHPCSHCVSINLIYLRDFFDLHPLCAEQNTVRTDPGSGGRIMFHDFGQSVPLAFGQRTHISHAHHSRGQCCCSARSSYDVPYMGAISYQKTFASALIRGNFKMLEVAFEHTERAWQYWLSRRSHKGHINWQKYEETLRQQLPLPKPRIIHSI